MGLWSRFYEFWIGDPAIAAIADEMNEWGARRGRFDDGLNAMQKMIEDGRLVLRDDADFADLGRPLRYQYKMPAWHTDEKPEVIGRINLSQRCDNCGAPSDLPKLSRQQFPRCGYCGIYFKQEIEVEKRADHLAPEDFGAFKPPGFPIDWSDGHEWTVGEPVYVSDSTGEVTHQPLDENGEANLLVGYWDGDTVRYRISSFSVVGP